MAEEKKEPVDTETKTTEAPVEQKSEPKAEPKKAEEPSVQELMDELAKLKRQADRNASEAAEFKRKYRESLSEVEKASMEKAEKEAEREEQFQALLRENSINKIEKSYLSMGWTADEATRMATAEADGDIDGKIKIMAEVDARKKKDYEAEFIKSRPDVNVGGGSGKSYTKEQFDKMGIVDRTKLKRENPTEYARLIAL